MSVDKAELGDHLKYASNFMHSYTPPMAVGGDINVTGEQIHGPTLKSLTDESCQRDLILPKRYLMWRMSPRRQYLILAVLSVSCLLRVSC